MRRFRPTVLSYLHQNIKINFLSSKEIIFVLQGLSRVRGKQRQRYYYHAIYQVNLQYKLLNLEPKAFDVNNNITDQMQETPIKSSELNIEEINFKVSDDPKPSDSRAKDYVLNDTAEILNFVEFAQHPINFIIEKETILTIKEYKPENSLADHHLAKLDPLSLKLATHNLRQKAKSSSIWSKICSCLTNKELRHLRVKKVIVNFNSCTQVSDKGIKSLTDFLKNFINIQHLEIEVNNTSATDESLAFISSLITSLSHITYIYVDFCGCRVADEGIFILASALKTKNNLEEVWLRFSWCLGDRITNEAIQTISKSIESCKKLRVLLLEFNGIFNITSKGVSSVLSSIQGLSSLRKLFLYFERAQVSDNFLIYAGDILPRFRNLNVFGLNIAHSSQITFKGIEKLHKAICSLGSLSVGLYLYLNGCLGTFEKEKARQLFEKLVKRRKVKNSVIEFA